MSSTETKEQRINAKIQELKQDTKHQGKSDDDLKPLATRLVGGEIAREKKEASKLAREAQVRDAVKEKNPELVGDALDKEVKRQIKVQDLQEDVDSKRESYEEAVVALAKARSGKGNKEQKPVIPLEEVQKLAQKYA